MAYSFVTYTSTGGQTYNVPFPYLDVDHVKVYVNGVSTSAFTWSDAATIHLNDAPAVGATILIKRETPRDGMGKSFSAQPRLKGTDLDEALLQAYYIGLEAIDGMDLNWSAIEAKDLALAAQGAAEDAQDAAEAAADLAASYAGSAGAGTYVEVPSAPTTDANEVKLYAKDVTGVTELFIRKESDGAEIQVTSGSILNGTPPDASESTKGIAELATQAEVDAGTDDARIVTPLKLHTSPRLYRKNLFINGGMQVQQRGDTAFTTSSVYGKCDRWLGFFNSATGSPTGTFTALNTVSTKSGWALKASACSCSATNLLHLCQRMESKTCQEVANAMGLSKKVSVSFKLYQDTGSTLTDAVTLIISTADTTDVHSAVTQRYSGAAQSLPSGAWTEFKYEGIDLGTTAIGNGLTVAIRIATPVISGKNFYLADAQFEIGPVCTSFELRPFGQELALCRRFFEKSYDYSVAPGTVSTVGAVLEAATRNSAGSTPGSVFKVSKRATPTIVLYSDNDGASGKVNNNGNKDGAAGRVGTEGFSFVAITSGDAANNATYHWTASAEL